MKILGLHSLLIAIALCPASIQAQSWKPARLSGTVRTSAGQRVANVALRIGIGPNVRTDSAGFYDFAKIPAGTWRLVVLCPSASYFHAQQLARIEVTAEQGADLVRDITADPAQCHERIDTVRGEFRGHWSVGFEESEFVPCPGAMTVNGSSIPSGWGGVWGAWRSGASPNWPDPMPAADTSGYGDRYYIRAEGILHGPGDFGHMSVAAYQLDIDKLLEVRTPGDRDCK